MQVRDVEVKKVEAQTDNELSDTVYRVCVFCDKVVRVNGQNFQSCLNLSGKKFYCPVCLRNNHHHRSSRNVLIFSYRGIIGYYYLKFYAANPQKMYLNQIESYIDLHARYGLQNPVFAYDPHTFLWFVDFNKVGNDPRKAPFEEVLKTMESAFLAFDLKGRIGTYQADSMWTKFEKAATIFYEKRKRPKDRRMLIPTLHGIVHQEKDEFFDATRDFVRNHLVAK